MNPAAPVTRTRISGSASEPDPVAHGAPDIDDVLAADLELAIRGVRCTEDDHVALPEHLLERHEAVVDDVWVRAQDLRPGPGEELPELVRKGRARVVRLGLERHAEDAD